MASILAILLAIAIAAWTESIVRRLRNNVKDGLCLWRIAAVRGQSSIAAIRARKCIVEFLHDGARMIDRVSYSPLVLRLMQANGARQVRTPAYVATGTAGVPGVLSFVRQPMLPTQCYNVTFYPSEWQ